MTDPTQRGVEGLVHLQGAAVELIAAARAFLDVVEELVTDPAAAATVIQTVAAVAGAVRAGGAPTAATQPGAGTPATTPEASRVTRIRLSDEA